MAKVKEPKGSKAKSGVEPLLSKVKNSIVTKPSQSPAMKSKKVAKGIAVKATSKKLKREPTPSSDEESESTEDESADSVSSSDEPESEAEVKKPAAVANGKTNGKSNGKSNEKSNGKSNGNGKLKNQETDTSDSSDSSSASDSEATASSSSDDERHEKPSAARKNEDNEDSEDTDDSENESDSGEAAPVTPFAKHTIKKSVDTKKTVDSANKTAVSTAKAIAKVGETSDEDSEDSDAGDSDDSGSSDSEEDNGENDMDDSADSDDEDAEEEEKVVPSKKRKADADPSSFTKKSKTEGTTVNEEAGPKNLFIGNLSWNVDDEWLYREFQEFGEVTSARVISDKGSGRSKGFGYVEFSKASDAAAALKAKKGALIDGREANVDFSTSRDNNTQKDRSTNRAQSFGDSKSPESDTLFVGNIPFDANEDMLGEAFGAYGTVVNVRLPTSIETGELKGFGYVTFSSVEDSKKAYENMMGAEVGGRPLRLDYATPRPDRNSDSPRGGRGGRDGGRGGSRGRGGFGDRGGRGGFGDRGGRGGRGGNRGGRGGSTNRGGFGDFKGQKTTF